MSRATVKIEYSYKDKGPNYEVNMHIDLTRFQKQFNRAQYELDNMIMTSMVPYMPMQTGLFIDVTRAMSAALAGTGTVVAAAPPMGRFLYEGKTMVDELTGSTWARKGAEKVIVSQFSGETQAKPKLEYSKHAHPDVTSHWFEKAKENHGAEWIKKAKKTAGGG